MANSRRNFLGSAALGGAALGMGSVAAFAQQQKEVPLAGDKGAPGAGGTGFQSVQLPPGATVAYHDPKDVEEMPQFVRSLDGSAPKVTSGGWAKESTSHQLPAQTGLAYVHMFLNPGSSRELHWHAIAAEWAYVIGGHCQTVVLDPSGQTEVNNYQPGDLWFFPKGHGHSIQTIGDQPCHFVLAFDNGAFSEHGTFSISDWISVTPHDMLARNFGLPDAAFDPFPKGETYIQAGPVIPASMATDAPWPRESTHKFSLLKDARAHRDFAGGSFRLASVDEWPISTTMSGALMTIKPGQMKELHWNPNADELQYYLQGKGQFAVFGSGGRGKVSEIKAGDSAYVPAGYGHAMMNTGTEDLVMVQTWNAGKFQEITLKHWMDSAPKYLLSNNMPGVPAGTLDKIQEA